MNIRKWLGIMSFALCVVSILGQTYGVVLFHQATVAGATDPGYPDILLP